METLRRCVVAVGVVGILVAVVLAVCIDAVFAEESTGEAGNAPVKIVTDTNANYYMAVVFGAAAAAGFGFLGGGYAVARVGAAALGAASERPELLTRSLIFVVLGEGIALFGVLVAFLLILQLPK